MTYLIKNIVMSGLNCYNKQPAKIRPLSPIYQCSIPAQESNILRFFIPNLKNKIVKHSTRYKHETSIFVCKYFYVLNQFPGEA